VNVVQVNVVSMTIFQVTNDKGRNDQFLPLFKEMKVRNMGKLVDDEYFIIDANFNINPIDKPSKIFHTIQTYSFSSGYKYVMYKLNKNAN
jgi:hypothetical protein